MEPPHDHTPFHFVTDSVPHSVELRLFYIEEKLVFKQWTKYNTIQQNDHSPGDFMHSRDDTVAARWMRGDVFAPPQAVAQAKQVAERWLVWLSAVAGEPMIPVIRFDFLIQYKPRDLFAGDAGFDKLVDGVSVAYDEQWNVGLGTGRNNTELMGDVEVWTLEISEAGTSTFGRNHILDDYMQSFVRLALKNG